MTPLEITRVVHRLTLAGIPTSSVSIARTIGEDEWAVRSALVAARTSGLLERRYRADLPFGERDTYITSFSGHRAVRELQQA